MKNLATHLLKKTSYCRIGGNKLFLRIAVFVLLLSPFFVLSTKACDGNLLESGSFENTYDGWETGSQTGKGFQTSYTMDGSYNGYIYQTTYGGTGELWQDIAAEEGEDFTLDFYAGVHDNVHEQYVYLQFLDASENVLSEESVEINHEVSYYNMGSYELSGTAPAGTDKVRVKGTVYSVNSYYAYLKMDGFCLTKEACEDPEIKIKSRIDGEGWNSENDLAVTVCLGAKLELKFVQTDSEDSFSWSGPGGISSSNKKLTVSNAITLAEAGEYTAELTTEDGCSSLVTLNVTVSAPYITPYVDENGSGWGNGTEVSVAEGGWVSLGTQIGLESYVSLTSPGGATDNTPDGDTYFTLSDLTLADAGEYTITYINEFGCETSEIYTITVFEGSGGSLPVEWLSFDASWNGSNIILEWTTAIEINADYFSIERSIDGISFEPLGRVEARGNTQTISTYSYADQNIDNQPRANFYYRLHQVDFDGKSSYSKVVEIIKGRDELVANRVTLMPNPASIYARFEVEKESLIESAYVYSITGQRLNIPIHFSGTFGKIDLSGLPAGYYNLVLISDGEPMSQKFTVR